MVLDIRMGDALLAADEATGFKMVSGTRARSGEEPLDSSGNHVPPL